VPHRVQEGDTRTVRPRPLTIAELEAVTEWYAALLGGVPSLEGG
jgi:hypothetical protein